MKKRIGGPVALLALALLLLVYGLQGVWRTPDVLQYAIEPPAQQSDQNGQQGMASPIDALIDKKDKVFSGMEDVLGASTMYGVAVGQAVQGDAQATATLLAVDKGYFEVFPDFLVDGRLIGDAECKGEHRVCVVDEKLAFALFRGAEAMGRDIMISGKEYRIIGITRYSRPIGQVDEYRAYIPLRAAEEGSLQTLNIAAEPRSRSGAAIMFKKTVQTEWMDGGSVYALEKEATRRLILLRMVLLIVGMYAIVRLYGWMNRRTRMEIEGMRRRLSQRYMKQIFHIVAARVALLALGYILITAALYGLMAYTFDPLYTFTEWVPECIVEWESLESVFRGLVNESSELISVSTIEMEGLNYYGGFVRWGCLVALVSLILIRISRKNA